MGTGILVVSPKGWCKQWWVSQVWKQGVFLVWCVLDKMKIMVGVLMYYFLLWF